MPDGVPARRHSSAVEDKGQYVTLAAAKLTGS
jgi:hypothetical protein